MVENEKVQEEVLRTGKVDTIVSEPIGVMLLHERMVSGGGLVGWLWLNGADDVTLPGRKLFVVTRLVPEAWRTDVAFRRAHLLYSFHRRGAVQRDGPESGLSTSDWFPMRPGPR